MAKKDMQYIMQTEASQILPIVRNKDGWLMDSYGQPIIVPGDLDIEQNTENDMYGDVHKSDTMKGLISAYQKLDAELKKQMAATVKDMKKIERCNKRLTNLKTSLLGQAEYIKSHLHLDIQTIVSEYTR